MFSTIDQEIRAASTDTFAGGVAGFGDLASAALDAAVYIDNSDGWYRSLDSAYDQRIEAVRLATGRTLENPLRAAEAEDRARMTAPRPNSYSGPMAIAPDRFTADNPPPSVQRAKARFEAELQAIAAQYPDKAAALGVGRPIETDAQTIAARAEKRLEQFSQSASGARKWAGLLYGGAAGSLRDPLQVMTMVLGGGPGAGRAVAGRILNVAMKEALVNGAVEAALQPGVQAWRQKAGLPAGFDEALRNVAFAAGLGGAFGGVLQGGGELIGRALRGRLNGPALERAAAELAANPGLSDRARAALTGEIEAARGELGGIREALPAEARGALDHAEDIATLDAARPKAVDPEIHDLAISRALDAAQTERQPAMPVNAAQIDRIALKLAPSPPAAARQGAPASLSDHLIAAGGVRDRKGEVAAVTGGDRVARPGKGTLVRADGMDLDSARLSAAEAGYMDRLYGTPEQAMARSSVADLLELLDEDLRGNRIFAGNDTAPPDIAAGVAAARDRIARDVEEFQKLAGPGLDDGTVIRALEIARDENIGMADAAERAIMELPEPAESGRAADAPPGWSEDDLLAASADRPPDFDGGGLDDPGNPPEWMAADNLADDLDALVADDELIPFDNGELVRKSQLLDDLDSAANEIMLVEACRA